MRRLKPAIEIISDIGCKAFDLQHHSEAEIAKAMAFMRAASNGPMFDWLVRVLSTGLPLVGEARRSEAESSSPSGNTKLSTSAVPQQPEAEKD